MDQMNERIKEVFSDEAYVQEFLAFETPEEAQASLEEKGIDMSIEELNQVADLLNRYSEGELSEEELADIAGGCALAVCITVATVIATVAPIIADRWDTISGGFSTAGRAVASGMSTAYNTVAGGLSTAGRAIGRFFRRW